MLNAAAAALVGLYFLWFAGPWIFSGFTPDDLMNCHRALEQPMWKLLLDHVTVFLPTPEYRPLGSLFYRVNYVLFGFDPLPFHVALYAVLAANIALTYAVVRRLGGTPAAAWIATVLHAWHGNWTGLHLSVGFCFDVLCYFFYTAALVAYTSGRHWLFLALFMLTLNSKEMAVSLPLVCLAAGGWRDRRQAVFALAAGAIAAAFIGGRLMSNHGLGGMEPYAPRIDISTFLSRVSMFLSMAVYGHGRLIWAVLLLAAAAGWSLIYRRRAAAVSLTLLVAGVLPVAFIAQRGLEAVYVPSLGAAILLALPLAHIVTRPLPALLVALLLAGAFHHLRRDRNREAHLSEANHIASVARQLRETAPCLRRGAQVLFRRDPFPRFDWNSLFLVHLVYNDREIVVHRPGRQSGPPERYDVVFDWDEGQGLLRRSSLDATRASTAPNNTPSK